MTIQEYQQLASKTLSNLDKEKNNLHMVLGMVTESAELADVFKKNIAYGKDIDLINVKEELGDLCWYVANICNINGWNLEDILQININKLSARYGDKFSEEKALNRDLIAERQILEQQ